jgi:hypothetical protein
MKCYKWPYFGFGGINWFGMNLLLNVGWQCLRSPVLPYLASIPPACSSILQGY